ncbi:MAG: hydrogenase nickel incorporation protein HypB [archaeon]|nr:hydrogenase nickel incorporation protein HypB [archaeon]
MHQVTSVEMEYDVLKQNNDIAHENYDMLKKHNITSVDFMGSIGSGKTTMIIKLAERLRIKGKKVCTIAGDVTGSDDFARMKASGLEAVNCNTGKECHLTASMIHKRLDAIDLDKIDVLFIENVGNLVCPADFPLGTDYRVVVISTTEGDDMVRKHPNIFINSDIAILNKIDIADAVDVDPEVILDDYNRITNNNKLIIKTSMKKDIGIDKVLKAINLE